ncbi:MAG: hypothetical protein HOP13_06635 [Alphaproteobacteria bacterium]|nr:hypothetical protein [Alphaproteobacteria bacterium]
MTATIWSKFFWSDCQAEPTLKRCSLAARGLWLEILCLAAQAEPAGYLVQDGKPLDVRRLARNAAAPEDEVTTLLAELETEGVFSRDRRGRIYSRRLVREAKLRASGLKTGKQGGNPSLCRPKEISPTLNGVQGSASAPPVGPISQKPYSISQKPAAISQGPSGRAGDVLPFFQERTMTPLLQRAAAAMRTDAALLAHKPAWVALPAFVVELVAQGCDAERDIWPVMERLAARLSEPPTSPAYFRDAILEARAKSAARAAWVSPEDWESRLRTFNEQGLWARKWGPKPGEPGYQGPELTLAEAV